MAAEFNPIVVPSSAKFPLFQDDLSPRKDHTNLEACPPFLLLSFSERLTYVRHREASGKYVIPGSCFTVMTSQWWWWGGAGRGESTSQRGDLRS